jgi:hypothetical protein
MLILVTGATTAFIVLFIAISLLCYCRKRANILNQGDLVSKIVKYSISITEPPGRFLLDF